MSYQEITVIGNLGNDPEMRYTPAGQAVTNFSIAANRQYKDASGEQVKITTWFRVSAWGKLAETANTWLAKGAQVAVKGRLNCDPATGGPRLYVTDGGVTRSSFEIDAKEIIFLKLEGVEGKKQQQQDDENIPF